MRYTDEIKECRRIAADLSTRGITALIDLAKEEHHTGSYQTIATSYYCTLEIAGCALTLAFDICCNEMR